MKTESERLWFQRFFGGLAMIALAINLYFAFAESGGSTRPDSFQPTALRPATVTTVATEQKSTQPEDFRDEFSVEARQMIASEIAHQDEQGFGRKFTVKCVSAYQSPRKFNGYGISTDVMVVTARFQLSSATSSTWSKTYDVSETIDSPQYQGLTSADTIQRVVATLKEQMQGDNEFLSVMQKSSNP